MNRGATLVLFVAATLLAGLLAPGVAAALGGWTTLPTPLPGTRLEAVGTFGDAGVVVAGAGAAVAVSGDGGVHWTAHPAATVASATTTLEGVAFTDAEHGVAVGTGGTVLVGTPDDSNRFAWAPAVLPDGVTGDLHDVAMSDTIGYAVGAGGVILATDDGGATWTLDNTPPSATADLNAVALSADGSVAVAVGAQGALLVNDNGRWRAQDTGTTADLLGVALPAAATAGTDVWFCSAAHAYRLAGGLVKPLTAPPAGGSISALALVEAGTPSRLVAGGNGGWLAGVPTIDDAAWARQTGGAASSVTALAAAGGGVCYATTAAGGVERGLNAGRQYTFSLAATPAATSTSTFKAIVTTGSTVSLRCSTTILAPGVILLEARPAYSTRAAWQTVAYGNPGETALAANDAPIANTAYRLRFLFAGATAATSTELRVGVRHRVSVTTLSYRVRLHAVYRITGSVAPTAPPGRSVEVWTDRAANHKLGPWHRVSLGGLVSLVQGRTFTTRAFGTPVRETYHLKIRMAGDAQHLVGWSARITVTVR
jgi:photosystem II stability/assembly factor-like uncharacterized protein